MSSCNLPFSTPSKRDISPLGDRTSVLIQLPPGRGVVLHRIGIPNQPKMGFVSRESTHFRSEVKLHSQSKNAFT